jgi:DNA-binding SARP family transcriptional activator
LHALEAMAAHLTQKGRWAEAVIAALAAIRAEPLRESAHGALIKVFLAEGNQMEALEGFNRYRTMLMTELGIEPTAQLTSLVSNLGRRHSDP